MKNCENKRRKDRIIKSLDNFEIPDIHRQEFQNHILIKLEKEIKNFSIDQSNENKEIILNSILDILDNVGSRYAERNNEILEALDELPEALVRSNIIEYDSGVIYEREYNLVMKVLNKKDLKSSFYKNDFLFKLTGYLKGLSPLALDRLNGEFYDALLKLVIKRFMFKTNKFNSRVQLDEIPKELDEFRKIFFSINKNKINYRFEGISYDRILGFLFAMEYIENWDSILSDLKAIHEDFYLKGHDCQYIIDNYFHGNVQTDSILKNRIESRKSTELNKCFLESNYNYKASRLYSEIEIDEMIKNFYMPPLWLTLLTDYELTLLMEKGHKVEIRHRMEFMELVKRLDRLNILTLNNLKRVYFSKNQLLTREMIIEMIKDFEVVEEAITKKLKKLFIV